MKDEEDMLELLDDEGATDQIDDLLDDNFDDKLDLELEDPDETLIKEPVGEKEVGETGETDEIFGDQDTLVDEPTPPEPPAPEEREVEIDLRKIIIAAAAIIAVILVGYFFILPMMSSSLPEVTITPSQQGEDINLYLVKGPALPMNEIKFTLNGAEVPPGKLQMMGGGSWPWKQGTSLKVDTSGYAKPGTLALISLKGGGQTLIFSTQAEPTPTPTPTPVPTPPPTQAPIIEPVPVTAVSSQVPPVRTAGSSGPIQSLEGSLIRFEALPMSGREPLLVQFADQTTICAQNRTWHFGDGLTSNKRYPEHVYPFPGNYTVTLDLILCDPDTVGEATQKEIKVIPVERKDTLLSGPGYAEVLPGGMLYFTVEGPGMTIRIGGRDYILNMGDQVKIGLNEGGKGSISIVSGAVIGCSFEDATIWVNEKELASGWLTDINIDKYGKISTDNINILIKVGEPGVKGLVNGVPSIIASSGDLVTLYNCGIDSTGKFIFSYQDQAGFTFRGGIESFGVTPSSLH